MFPRLAVAFVFAFASTALADPGIELFENKVRPLLAESGPRRSVAMRAVVHGRRHWCGVTLRR
jgi:hypothetical protein